MIFKLPRFTAKFLLWEIESFILSLKIKLLLFNFRFDRFIIQGFDSSFCVVVSCVFGSVVAWFIRFAKLIPFLSEIIFAFKACKSILFKVTFCFNKSKSKAFISNFSRLIKGVLFWFKFIWLNSNLSLRSVKSNSFEVSTL